MQRALTNVLVAVLLATPVAEGQRPSYSGPGTSQVKAPKRKAKRAKRAKKPYQVGTASWYGRRFQGKTTASGEPFNMFELTAAHRQLPMGTQIQVTNLTNGRWVVVRVNDRGPVPESRVIDLSYYAAELLGLSEKGIERVRLDIIEPPTLAMTREEPPGTP